MDRLEEKAEQELKTECGTCAGATDDDVSHVAELEGVEPHVAGGSNKPVKLGTSALELVSEGVFKDTTDTNPAAPTSTHPLLVYDILEHIFKTFDRDSTLFYPQFGQEEKHLKTFRTVCKSWNFVATKLLQQRFRTREKYSPIGYRDGKRNFGMMLESEGSLRSITELNRNAFNPLHVDFVLSAKSFTLGREDVIKDFFKVCGPQMQRLFIKLNGQENDIMNFGQAQLVDKDMKFPNLKKFVFLENPTEVQFYEKYATWSFCKALLRASTQPDEVSIGFFNHSDLKPEHVNKISELSDKPANIVLNNLPDIKTISKLALYFPMDNNNLAKLANFKDLELKTLELEFFNASNVVIDADLLFKVLESQCQTLEVLHISKAPGGSTGRSETQSITVRFPLMAKLERINIESDDDTFVFRPIDYKSQLPKLVAMYLEVVSEVSWNSFFKSTSPALALKYLDLPKDFQHPQYARSFARLFPNLSTLKIWFWLTSEREDTMYSIFDTMEKLEVLTINCDMKERSQFIDHVFTGLPEDVCHKMLRKWCFEDDEKINEFLDGRERKPSVAKLKGLKVLHIVQAAGRVPAITDVSARQGFAKMVNLEFMEVPRYCGMEYGGSIERSEDPLGKGPIGVHFWIGINIWKSEIAFDREMSLSPPWEYDSEIEDLDDDEDFEPGDLEGNEEDAGGEAENEGDEPVEKEDK